MKDMSIKNVYLHFIMALDFFISSCCALVSFFLSVLLLVDLYPSIAPKCIFFTMLCVTLCMLLAFWLNNVSSNKARKEKTKSTNKYTPTTEEWLVLGLTTTTTATIEWNLMILSLLLQRYCHSCRLLLSTKYYFLCLCSFLLLFICRSGIYESLSILSTICIVCTFFLESFPHFVIFT